MEDQSSHNNAAASNEATKKEVNWKEDVYETYLAHVEPRFKYEREDTDSTSKDTHFDITENETALEKGFETNETAPEEEDDLTSVAFSVDEETSTPFETSFPKKIIIFEEEDNENERIKQKESDLTVRDNTVAENEIIITGDDIVIAENEEEGDAARSFRKPTATSSLKKIKGKLVCVIGRDHSFGLAQEPWPKDVKLYQPYEVEQILLPDNANCLAVQAFLRMCNLDFEVVSRANAEFMSPSGKVPFIKCGAFIVSELEGIVQFVNNKGISLTANMETEQKSDMRAYMSLVHNVLENAELYLCWCDKETYNEVTKPRNGSVYPWPLNYFQTWSKKSAVCKRLKMMGWYNKTLEDVYQEVENCCQALTDRLEGKDYFFGKRHTEMDALVYGHIYSILTSPLPTDDNRLAYLVQRFEKLTDHCRRIHKQVMNQDNIFVVATYSRMTLSATDNDAENYLLTDSDDIKEPADFDEAGSGLSSDINTDDLLTDL